MSRLVRGIAPSKVEFVAEVELSQWLRAYHHTHSDGKRLEWPDGGSYADQLNVTIELWELIADELRLARKGAK